LSFAVRGGMVASNEKRLRGNPISQADIGTCARKDLISITELVSSIS
jgi:hypothetical protein